MACAKRSAYWLHEPNGQLNQADEEIRTLDPLLGKEMLYH
jgi:hypothetical protein